MSKKQQIIEKEKALQIPYNVGRDEGRVYMTDTDSLVPDDEPGNGHKKWLVTIARNMAVDRIRKIDREALVDEIPETGQSGSMEEQVVNSVSLKVAMESLKPDEREIVDMKVAGGFTFREISEIVGKPMGTVTWLYNSAIKRLRRCRL